MCSTGTEEHLVRSECEEIAKRGEAVTRESDLKVFLGGPKHAPKATSTIWLEAAS